MTEAAREQPVLRGLCQIGAQGTGLRPGNGRSCGHNFGVHPKISAVQPDLVMVSFVFVTVFVVACRKILMRVILEGFLAAGGAEIVRFSGVLAFVLSGLDFDFHLAYRVDCGRHKILLSNGFHYWNGITFTGQRIAVTAGGAIAERDELEGIAFRFIWAMAGCIFHIRNPVSPSQGSWCSARGSLPGGRSAVC